MNEQWIKWNHEKIETMLKLKAGTALKFLKFFRWAKKFIANCPPRLSEKNYLHEINVSEQKDWKWKENVEEDFNELKNLLAEMQCPPHVNRDQNNIVMTDASRTGLGVTPWEDLKNITIRRIAY